MSFYFLNRRDINIDLSHRCGLECPRCLRTYWKTINKKVPGYDMTEESFKKIISFYNFIIFCGQYSDPAHHPKFVRFLELCNEKNKQVSVHNASSLKSKDWYISAFKAYPNAIWNFGIDGLPKDSHKYRINQDGEKLFDIMLESKKYLSNKPIWQYIVFSYNENNVEEAKKIAKENNIKFSLTLSSRWWGNDELRPKNNNLKLEKM